MFKNSLNEIFKGKKSDEECWGQDYSTGSERRLIRIDMDNAGSESTKRALREAPEENWEEDYRLDEKKKLVQFRDINPKAKLKFAKRILLFLLLLFIGVVTVTYLFPDNKQVERVWSYTSAGIYSIAGILIGYYFTSNK